MRGTGLDSPLWVANWPEGARWLAALAVFIVVVIAAAS